MKLKVIVSIVLTLFLANMLTLTVNVTSVEGGAFPNATTNVYVYPATITATAVGQAFTVEIRIDNVTDLKAYQIGLTWDPNFLEVNMSGPNDGFSFGPFLGTPDVDYLAIAGKINNITGEIYPPYAASRIWWAGTVNGSGILAYVDFVAKAIGTSNVHPAEIRILDSEGKDIPTNIVDIFTVIWEGEVYPTVTVHNLTSLFQLRFRVSNYGFDPETKEISFNVTGFTHARNGATAFFNVTIPKKLLSANATHPWKVLLDGNQISYTKVENTTHTFIYFTSNRTTQNVQIIGTILPEFPTWTSMLLILIVLTVAIAINKRRLLKTPIH